MDLLTFISDPARKQALVERVPINAQYLWQLATRWRQRRASPELAIRLELETGLIGPEAVPKESIRPDIWQPQTTEEKVA